MVHAAEDGYCPVQAGAYTTSGMRSRMFLVPDSKEATAEHPLLATFAGGDFFHTDALDVLAEDLDGPEGGLSRLVALDGTGDIPECAREDGLGRIPLFCFKSFDFTLYGIGPYRPTCVRSGGIACFSSG